MGKSKGGKYFHKPRPRKGPGEGDEEASGSDEEPKFKPNNRGLGTCWLLAGLLWAELL